MKKYMCICTIFLSLLLVLPMNAQSIKYGMMGGPNFSDMEIKSSSGTERLTSSRTLLGIGAVVDLGVGPFFNVSVEPTFLQKGGTEMASSTDPTNIDITMNFLEIPILLKLEYGTVLKPYFKLGPTFGFLLSSKAEGEVGGVVSGMSLKTYEADLNGVLENQDIGFCVGAGASLWLGGTTIFLDARYNTGFQDMWKGGTIEWEAGTEKLIVESSPDAELKTNGVQVMFGVLFPL